MVALVIGMLLCLAAAGVVVGKVSAEARREGREMWTPEGEELVTSVRDRVVEHGEAWGKRAKATLARR